MPAKIIKKSITTKQILEAYEAHGDDFVVIDIDNLRNHKGMAQYIPVNIKLADGAVVPVNYWKLNNDGTVIVTKIRNPDKRRFEAIRLGVALYDEDGNETENASAFRILCLAAENKLTEMKTQNIITDNERSPRKQPDGTFRPVWLISTKIVSPMQTTRLDKETDEYIDLENPLFWISVPKRRFFKNPADQKPSVHFEGKYYLDENGVPNPKKPIMTHEYASTFYNVDDWYHHARTGKKVFNKLGATDDEGNVVLDNINIQDFLTKNSAIMCNIKFEVIVSARQCKFDISLYGNCYVKRAAVSDDEYNNVDTDEVDAFASKHNNICVGTTHAADIDDADDVDDADDADF